MSQYHVMHGDCLEELKQMPENFVDSIITDPPAGIAFMNKEWDKDKGGRDGWIEWLTTVMVEAKRVLKPGGHAFVWAIPRTSHWTATALEDAGFEIRDIVTHVFGSGFPKSQNISKAMDKAAGAEREVVGVNPSSRPNSKTKGGRGFDSDLGVESAGVQHITAPATDDAKKWSGFGTALKPAAEFWVLCRKPLEEKTVYKNVLKHGTGGINIDASRIRTDEKLQSGRHIQKNREFPSGYKDVNRTEYKQNSEGRFPANFVMSHHEECVLLGEKKVKGIGGGSVVKNVTTDFKVVAKDSETRVRRGHEDKDGTETVPDYNCHPECPVKLLDEQSGSSPSNFRKNSTTQRSTDKAFFDNKGSRSTTLHNDTGGASRFFYCAKPSKREKNAGIENREAVAVNDGRQKDIDNAFQRGTTERKNTHPTVKSKKLMAYLITMVTPPGGIVLDPFMGSGSTGIAALEKGFDFIGIEAEAEYLEIAEARLKHAAGE